MNRKRIVLCAVIIVQAMVIATIKPPIWYDYCGFIRNVSASQRLMPATCEGCPGIMTPKPLYLHDRTHHTMKSGPKPALTKRCLGHIIECELRCTQRERWLDAPHDSPPQPGSSLGPILRTLRHFQRRGLIVRSTAPA